MDDINYNDNLFQDEDLGKIVSLTNYLYLILLNLDYNGVDFNYRMNIIQVHIGNIFQLNYFRTVGSS